MIHGGFWRARYGRKLMRDLCQDLAERGWAAWNIEYRRLGRGSGGGWPTTFADVAAAIDHLEEIRTITRDVLDRLEGRVTCDLVSDVAQPVVARVI